MANKRSPTRPTTIAEYIRAAPRQGQPHLRRLYAILKSVAPQATEVIRAAKVPIFLLDDHQSIRPDFR